MIHELRTYEIPNNVRKTFHERFEKHAMRIMERHGIKILMIWDEEIGDMQNFCYIIEWQSLAEREEKWPKFNSDEEWSRIKKESAEKHGELVRRTHNKFLRPTKYSPIK